MESGNRKLYIFISCMTLATGIARAGWMDLLKSRNTTNVTAAASSSLSIAGLSEEQVSLGLKEALAKGVSNAVTNLGKPGGFLNNSAVRIPMPEKLSKAERALRMVGQDRLADEFVTTMNHAAEEAVPEARAIFIDSLKQMTVQDAKAIATGPNDAATQFFKKTGEKRIQDKMLPIVKQATEKTGATANYKKLMEKAAPAATLLHAGKNELDLDTYITQKASDGLFKMIAEEEKRIRTNPAARTTELLQKVFGANSK